MNKIIYITIGVIWFIVVCVVVMGVLVAPDLDTMGSLQRYKSVVQKYLDRKDIDPSSINVETDDDKFIQAYAKYMQAFQISENEYNAKQRLFRISLDAQNLRSIDQVNAAYAKLDSLAKQTQSSYDLLVNAQAVFTKSLKVLKDKDLKIYGKSLDDAIEFVQTDEVQFRDDITKYRLACEKYYKAILDFLVQKQGAYQVNGAFIVFTIPEEQQYYEQLKQGQKTYEQQLIKAFEDYQQEMRKASSDIPVDIQ